MRWLLEALAKAGISPAGEETVVTVVPTNRFVIHLGRRTGAHHPAWVAKLPRDEEGVVFLEREATFLSAWRPKMPAELQPTLPEHEAVLTVESGERLWVQTGLPGASMSPTAGPVEVARVREWLRALWAVHQGPLREAEELLGEVRTGDGESGGDRLRLAEEAAKELAGVVRRVLGHSDLNPANVIVHPDGIGVVDWVWATDEKLPLVDWFHFVAHRETQASFGPTASAEDWRRVLARLVDEQTPAGQLLKSGAVDLAASLDLTPRQAGLLFRLYLCSRLHNIIRRDVGDAAEAVTQAALPALADWR